MRRCTAHTTGKMDAPRLTWTLCLLTLFICVTAHNIPEKEHEHEEDNKLELYDGVYLTIPKSNSTGRLLSFEVDTGKNLNEGKIFFIDNVCVDVSGCYV